MLEALISRQRSRAIETINRLVPWHKLPTWLGLANLIELRETLRAENLHDTNGIDPGHPGPLPAPVGVAADGVKPLPVDSAVLRSRSADGSYNDLESPRMGMAGTRFGRNIPLTEIETQIDSIVTRLKRDGPTADELKRVKAGQELDFLSGLQSNLGKAFQLAEDQTFRNDPSYTFRVGYAKSQAVTAAAASPAMLSGVSTSRASSATP